MKRIITTLLFLSMTFGLFAETGYNKFQWRIPKESVKLLYPKKPGEDKRWETTKAEEKSILGEENTVFYHFYGNQLLTVSYNLPPNKARDIKSKYKKKIYEVNTISMDKEYYVNSLTESGTLTDVKDTDLALNCLIAEATLDFEIEGFKILDEINIPEGKALISVYDYNDDTRVCLWENFINGTVFVIYYYHNQDY